MPLNPKQKAVRFSDGSDVPDFKEPYAVFPDPSSKKRLNIFDGYWGELVLKGRQGSLGPALRFLSCQDILHEISQNYESP